VREGRKEGGGKLGTYVLDLGVGSADLASSERG
jgi:hypothetical protein